MSTGTAALARSQRLGIPSGRWVWAGKGLAGGRWHHPFLPYSMPAEKPIKLRCHFAALGQFLLYLDEAAQQPHTA